MTIQNEEEQQSKTETGILILDNPRLYDLVVRRISDEVEGRLLRRVFVALSVVGVMLGILSFVYHTFIVEKSANEAVNRAIGEIREQVEVASLSLELTELINSIHQGVVFSAQEKNTAIRLLERSAKLPTFIERDSFLFQLERLLEALAAAGIGPDINRLEELYRNQISKSDGIVSTLAQHYSREILSTPDAPDDWNSVINSANFDRQQTYIRLAKSRGYPEFYIFFQMLVKFLQSDENDDVVQKIIDEIKDLNENGLSNFLNLVQRFAMNKISVEPTAETTRISERTIAFLEKHQDAREEFRLILNMVKSTSSD